jgi:Rod binding domain-containing protein
MLTDSLAQKLTEGRGMGLAPMIAKQLTPRGIPVTTPPLTPAAE